MSARALMGLDDQQREAAALLRGPVCVLAGAGTGKTRVITHRIAHGVDTGAYSPSRVMAVTFTAKAAGEMRGRLRALGVEGVAARTFHATALAQLNFFWPQLARDTAPSIIDNKVRVLGQAADSLGLRLDGTTLRDVASRIEWRKVAMHTIDQDAAAHPEGLGPALDANALAELQHRYEKVKDERRQLDFEDVLLACAGMLESEPRVAAAVHEQYRHLTVEEFQDVSPVQYRLLELWLGDRRDPHALRPDEEIAIFRCLEGQRLPPHAGPALRVALDRQHIRPSDEFRDEASRRPIVDVLGIADLGDATAMHHRDAIAHRQGLDLIMGDEECGDAERTLDRADLVAHRVAKLGVEIGEGFVEQKHRGPDHQRPR